MSKENQENSSSNTNSPDNQDTHSNSILSGFEINSEDNSSKDPIKSIIEILEHPTLSNEDKKVVVNFAKNRFLHRRALAYMSFGAMVLSLVLISTNYELANSDTLIYLDGFFAMIIATYYGVSSFKPSS